MPGLEKSPPWPRGPGPWRDRPGRTQPPAGLPEKPAESVLYAYIPRFAAFSGAVFFLTLAGGRRARHRLTQEAWSLDFCATIDTAKTAGKPAKKPIRGTIMQLGMKSRLAAALLFSSALVGFASGQGHQADVLITG